MKMHIKLCDDFKSLNVSTNVKNIHEYLEIMNSLKFFIGSENITNDKPFYKKKI